MSESDGEGPSLDDNATSKPRDNLLHRERAAISAVSVTLNIEGDILHGDVQNNVFACITDRGRLIVNFEDGRNPYTRTYTQQPSALFLDPTGCHLLVPFPSGELEYCNLEVRYSTKIPVVSPALAAVSKNPMATAASLASSSIAGLAAGITPFSTNQASVNASNTPFVTTAVGWDMTNTASRSTGVVLLGSKDGALVEVRLDTSYVDGTKSVAPTIKPLVAAGNPKFAFTEPIASIAVERFAGHGKVVILLATTSRLVRCCGTYNPNSLRTAVEKKVGETNKSSELRGGTVGNNGRIAVYRANIGAPAVGWAWNSPAGIYHGLFKVVPTIVSEARKRSATSLDYDVDDEDDKSAGADIITLHKIPLGFKYAEIPMDIALSAHHMLLMYSDRIAVLHAPAGLRWAPTRLQGKESIEKLLPITEEHITERLRKTFGLRGVGKAALRSIGERRSYFVTTTGFCQMEFRHEHRVTWRLFLERALDAREDADVRARYFNAAYNIVCTFEPAKKDMVAFARGKFFTEMQLYEAAAAQFADCGRVGDIIPYLTETAPTSTLLAYLHARIAKREEAAKQALSASDGRHFALGGKRPWRDPELASLIVVALNTHADRLVVEERRDPRTSDTTIVAEYKEALDDFVASRVPFIHALNDDHYYEVIQWMLAAQGQTETRVMLSVKVRKFRVSIMSYIAHQEFVAACRVLTQRCQEAQYAPLWYEFGPLFVSKCPDDFFEGLYKTIKEKLGGRFDSFLRPELLLPAFTGVLQWDTDAAQVTGRYVLEYFHRLVTNNVTIPAVVWNFYVLLCTKLDSRLLGDVLVDARRLYSPAYALRKILESSDTSVLKCIISIYKELKQIREAVKIAVDTHVDGDDLLEEAKALIKDTDLDRATQKSLWKDIAVRTADNPSSTAQQILQVVAESNGDLTLDDVMPLLAKRQTRLTEVKDPICRALQGYSDRIKIMKDEMDVANLTAAQIRDDEEALRNQCGFISYRLKCDICNKPLLASGGRVPFVVYPPCRHVFHEDCATEVYAHCSAERLEAIGEELGLDPSECHDPTVFRDTDCPTCGELAVAQIDDPYFDEHDAEQAVWNVLF